MTDSGDATSQATIHLSFHDDDHTPADDDIDRTLDESLRHLAGQIRPRTDTSGRPPQTTTTGRPPQPAGPPCGPNRSNTP
ncbi:hypothetical protein ACFV0L_03595 [Streptosporangium canum]|uniref:hypothetical protein n=1 Tax=Streptosporangium canum TaxID=324952 RepID=UPI00369F3A97